MGQKLPTIKIQQKDGLVPVRLMAFFPNLRAGRNRGYVIVPNDGSIHIREDLIHVDETGKYLYVSELAIPPGTRVSLHKQAREKNDKPLIHDERAASLKFVW